MSFADNLKKIRKNKNLSQEELAEILGVSRQAVSKWEQNMGYPEVEKLLVLSSQLHVSLDDLLATEIAKEKGETHDCVSGNITINSLFENVVVTCYKVEASKKMKGGSDEPHYALFAVSDAHSLMF